MNKSKEWGRGEGYNDLARRDEVFDLLLRNDV
jgi:hypothetical protein